MNPGNLKGQQKQLQLLPLIRMRLCGPRERPREKPRLYAAKSTNS